MALYFLIFAICLIVVGGTVALMMSVRTPRYRTEPKHLLALFERVLANQATENEWDSVVGYPIRHNDYLESVRCSAQRLMDEHGRPWRAAQGESMLSRAGQKELSVLRDHLAAHITLQEGQREF